MPDLTVRPVVAGDAEAFVRAYEASWDATIGVIAGRPLRELSPYEDRLESFRTTFGAELPPGAGAWVAERDGEATLWVGEANGRARRFYEREGWEPTGETKASELGPEELQYRRQLPA